MNIVYKGASGQDSFLCVSALQVFPLYLCSASAHLLYSVAKAPLYTVNSEHRVSASATAAMIKPAQWKSVLNETRRDSNRRPASIAKPKHWNERKANSAKSQSSLESKYARMEHRCGVSNNIPDQSENTKFIYNVNSFPLCLFSLSLAEGTQLGCIFYFLFNIFQFLKYSILEL